MKTIHIFFITAAIIGFCNESYSQSDNCATATPIDVSSGSACVNGTTIGATSDLILYGGCNPAIVNEVWYTFVAAGSQNDFTITSLGLTDAEIIIDASAGGCGDGIFDNCVTVTGSATLTTSWGVVPGTQIWIGIASNGGTEGDFQLCIDSYDPPPGGGNACSGAIPVCDVTQVYNTPDIGVLSSSGTLPSCFGSPVNQDIWYQFTVTQTGILEWEAVPFGANIELDWALYDITGGCPGVELVCNYNYTTGASGPAGMITSASCAVCPLTNLPGTPCGEYCDPVTVTAGNTYVIVIDNYTSTLFTGLDFYFGPGMTAEIAPDVNFSISPIGPQCVSSVTISITDSTIGIPTYDFGDGSPTYTGNSPPNHTYSTPGVYAITATIGGACPSIHTEFIELYGPLSTTTSSVDASCGSCNGEASVSATGGDGIYSYSWDIGDTTPVITGLCAGSYTITVFNATCGTSVIDSVVVANTSSLAASIISSTNVSCFGYNDGTATVSVTGGTAPYTYLWTPSGGTGATGAGLSDDTYTVTVTDSNGCIGSNNITITEPAPLIANGTSSPSTCGGSDGTATVSASGGIGVYTYAWSPIGGTDSTASNLPAGTYSFIVTDSNGCTQTDSIVVANTGGPVASITSFTNVSCFGGSDGTATVSVTGGTLPYTYLWSPSGGIGAVGTGLSDGFYTVTVTDSNGCINLDNITITEPTPLIANGTSLPSTCGDSNGVAIVIPLGGTPPYTYLWDDPNTQTNDTAFGLMAGPPPYNVLVTDANGCTLTFPVAVSNIPEPVIDSITTTDVTCNGEATGSATVSISGGTLPFTYLWDDSLSQTTITATGLVASLVSITVTDLNGCVVTGSVTVAEPDSLIIDTLGANICDGGSSQISAIPSGGTGAYSYSWDNGLPDTSAHIVSPNTTTTYSVIVIDENGCLDSATITVIVSSPLTVSDSSAEICEGESVVLSVTPSGGNVPYYYTWNDGSNGSSITVSPLATISYTVIVSDSCSPDDTAIVNVIVNPLPTANFDAACFPDPFITQFTNNSSPISGSAFLWDFGDGNSSTEQNPSHVFNGSGNYTVNLTVTTDKGCSNDTAITIQAPPMAEFILTPNETTTANPEINFTDLSNTFSNVVYWEWDFGDGYGIDNLSGQAGSDSIPFGSNLTTGTYQDPTHTYNDAGTYYILLTVYNADGCRDTAMLFVNIFSEYFLFVPNAFTPNRDKINDVFMPQGVGINEGNFEMSIFNRWGDLIYETNDINKGWDGKANSGRKIAQTDVYIWLIKTKDPRGNRHYYTGHVTLIR